MNFIFRISATFLLILGCLFSSAQAYEAPKPKMNNNVLKKFLASFLVYPQEAVKNKDQGTIWIAFNINEKGKIENRQAITHVSSEIDSAALKLFDLIIWDPAFNYGKPVIGDGRFKIKYNLGKYESLIKKRGYDQLPVPFKEINPTNEVFTIKNLDIAPKAKLDTSFLTVQDFIGKTLQYPESASKLSIAGDVKLRFVVEPCGLPSNIMVIEPVGGGCTEEAIRIVQLLKWAPGIKDDLAVRTCYNISIKFDPADELRNKHIPNQSNSGM